MFKYIKLLLVYSFWGMLACSPAAALTEEENGTLLAAAIAQIKNGHWEDAAILAGRIKDPVALEIIDWMKLRDGAGNWPEYNAFLSRNPDWPGLKRLRRQGEGVMPANLKPDEVFAYFKDQRPQTGTGSIRLTEAYQATGQNEAARKEAIRAWLNFNMSRDERVTLNKRFEKTLKKYHVQRLDMLLWRNRGKPAAGLYTLVPEGYEALAKARLALRAKKRGVNSLISAVPKNLLSDPGLNYERFNWRARKGLYDTALELLIESSATKKKLGKPEYWAPRRRSYARQEMRNGNNKTAYFLASHHFLTKGSDYADLEWLSGYIALRKLDDPHRAIEHFKRFQAAVATPISYGRAGYWLGRAYEEIGDKANAKSSYEFGARYQTSFYGQLAAERIKARRDDGLAGRETAPNWRKADFLGRSVFRAAILLHYADQGALTERFIKQIAETQDRVGIMQLAEITLEIGRPNITVRLSKQAVRQGIVLPKYYFPLTALAKQNIKVKPEEAMSIARRESELDQYVISPAGARGLMQIMPATARKVAGDLGIRYSKDKLTEDWKYNARLGSTYLAEQLEEFNGSFILAFAAYNAGPHRARTWIAVYGDPRRDSADQVDWIEHIPFRETRNYVMRVVESLHVYRARIAGKTPKLRITKDLKRG